MFETILLKLDKTQRSRITEAMNKITEQTQEGGKNIITFKARNNEDLDYIKFVK